MYHTFEYGSATVGMLSVETESRGNGRPPAVTGVTLKGERLDATDRFWRSLYQRYGFSSSMFRFFSHAEVFRRITQVSPRDRLRYCIERNKWTGTNRLLAVSNPRRAVVTHDQVTELTDRYEAVDVRYYDGIVESEHIPRSGTEKFQISGDRFANRFVLQTPIDGYGQPSIYLAMWREVCSNGMVGLARAFRSELVMGRGNDTATYSLRRALDGFDSDEGYAALRQRFESAAHSWASVHESMSLYRLCTKLIGEQDLGAENAAASSRRALNGTEVLKSFHKLTGDIMQLYGLANLDALSTKRQRTLPVECKVYELLNFATELSTHHATTAGARRLQAWVGTLLSNEYDLEGTADQYGEFRDFFVGAKE